MRDEDTRSINKADGDVAPGERDRPCLIVIRGLNVGEMYKLGAAESIIGRGQGCEVEILDDGISRRHAAIAIGAGGVTLRDIGSRNGTYVNGQRVEAPVALHDGDKIQLSSTTILKFTYADRL